jgi:signal transduction histidine kinase
MSDSPQSQRLLRIWSAMIAAIIVAVAVFQPEGPTKIVGLYVVAWAICFALFLVLVWMKTAPVRTAAIQSALVLLMVPLSPAIGSEAALFVIVAFVVAQQLPAKASLAWVLAQSVLMFAMMSMRWSVHHSAAIVGMSVPFQLLALYTGRVLRGEMQARADLARANAELRATQHLLADSNRAAERFRISRELHDVFGHRLTALSLHLEIATVAPVEERPQSVARAYAIAKELLGDVRGVVENLRDGAHVDLTRALESLTGEVPRPRVHLELPPTLVVDSGTQAHVLLRCAQEVLTNAMKHSDARHLWLKLTDSAAGVEMVAIDDGRGAPSLHRGNGLRGLEERLREVGGELEAGNAADGGFRVRVLIPATAR